MLMSCRSLTVCTACFGNYIGHFLLKKSSSWKKWERLVRLFGWSQQFIKTLFFCFRGQVIGCAVDKEWVLFCFSVVVFLVLFCFLFPFLFFCSQECHFGKNVSEELQSYISLQFSHKNVWRKVRTFEEVLYRNVIIVFFLFFFSYFFSRSGWTEP